MHFKDGRYLSLTSGPSGDAGASGGRAELHAVVETSAAGEKTFTVENFTSEWDVVNKDAEAPEDKYRLYTLLSKKPRLCVCPDYMFVVRGAAGRGCCWANWSAGRIIRRKQRRKKVPDLRSCSGENCTAGSAPTPATSSWCSSTAPDARWRNHLVKAFATKQEPTLYRIAALP